MLSLGKKSILLRIDLVFFYYWNWPLLGHFISNRPWSVRKECTQVARANHDAVSSSVDQSELRARPAYKRKKRETNNGKHNLFFAIYDYKLGETRRTGGSWFFFCGRTDRRHSSLSQAPPGAIRSWRRWWFRWSGGVEFPPLLPNPAVANRRILMLFVARKSSKEVPNPSPGISRRLKHSFT